MYLFSSFFIAFVCHLHPRKFAIRKLECDVICIQYCRAGAIDFGHKPSGGPGSTPY